MKDKERILERLNNRLWNLSITVMTHAASLGNRGAGFAVVARETRALCDQISARLDAEDFDDSSFGAIFNELNFLAMNAALEAIASVRDEYGSYASGKALAVCAEDIRQLAMEISEILSGKKVTTLPLPDVSPVLNSVCDRIHLLQFTIGGKLYVENANHVWELLYMDSSSATGNLLPVRGNEYPIADVSTLRGAESHAGAYVIVRTVYEKKPRRLAIPIDGLDANALIYVRIGGPLPENQRPANIRESWNSDVGPLHFPDWGSLA